MGWHFRILALLGTVSVPAVVLLQHRPERQGWRSLDQVLAIDFQQQILKDNLQPGTQINLGQMKVLKVSQLYLIDTRTTNPAKDQAPNPLCGAERCLFLGYSATTRQRVLNLYLNPNLPPKVTLIQPIAKDQTPLPCLRINQLEHQKIRTAQLCFNGTTYETIEVQLLPEVYE
jgi:hypothetical protein